MHLKLQPRTTMNLIKYDSFYQDPWTEMDRWFERAFGPAIRWPDTSAAASGRSFRLDLHSDEDNYYVVAELPGFRKSDVKVDLHNAVLTIDAQRKVKEGKQEHTYHFQRSVTVGDGILGDKVKAKLENGILTVTLPKREERKPKAIQVA